MLITRRSPLTGQINEWDIPINITQLADWADGALLQNIAPRLSLDEREFLISGLMPGEFEIVFGPEDL